ncbi:DMT family transporter [Dehalobacterium formicoaceticum]|uniref:DMT family transporter n=1 Tax=Dehalobacterium formicoaceticum TaxID=51515 RepID=A0ABT1Y598_9FIRM|nr:DMT family transporter [Dehalobacterium formicoaceticum]MCR6545094.1 DMT family transporter [Dehalobacterium formicoaceticum]
MKISSEHAGVIFTLASAMLFAAGPIIIKLAYQVQLSNWQFLSLQYLWSVALLLPLYLLGRNKHPEQPMTKEKLGSLALQGSIGAFGGAAFLFTGYQYIGAAVGTVIFYTYPAFVALGARIFFRERLGKTHFICLFLTFIGVLLTIDLQSFGQGDVSLKGVLLIFASTLCYAFFSLYGERNLKLSSPLEVTFFTQMFALLTCLIIKPPYFLFQGVSKHALLLGFAMAFLTSVCSYLLLFKGISLIGASKSAVIGTFQIPFAIFLAMVVLKEHLTLSQFIGASLILGGIIYLYAGKNHDDRHGFRQDSC